jgi:hypothetical protein
VIFGSQQLQLIGCRTEEIAVPNCDFYAAPGDFEPILRFIFEDMDCRVFEAYSRFDHDLREFSRLEEIVDNTHSRLEDRSNSKLSFSLMLWPFQASNQVRIRRIELNPAARLGKYRHTVEGWGLISLQLRGLAEAELHPSHTNHNSENRAKKWAGTYKDTMGDPSAWNWDIVTGTSAKLNRHIRSLATAKIGSRPVLPAAKKALDAGARAM